MAWTPPRTWVTADLVTGAMMNTHVRDNENFLRAFHGGRMWESAAESQTATSAWQLVQWDATDYDTDSFNVLGSEWFVVPTGFDGYYRVSGAVTFSGNATGFRTTRIVKNETYTTRTPNGVGTVIGTSDENTPGGVNPTPSPVAIVTVPLVAGDHVTLEATQTSGGNLAFIVGKSTCWFDAHYLGS